MSPETKVPVKGRFLNPVGLLDNVGLGEQFVGWLRCLFPGWHQLITTGSIFLVRARSYISMIFQGTYSQ